METEKKITVSTEKRNLIINFKKCITHSSPVPLISPDTDWGFSKLLKDTGPSYALSKSNPKITQIK